MKYTHPFRYYDNFPNLSGNKYFEDILDWILDIEDFFENAKIPSEEKWIYLWLKFTDFALSWWLDLQSSRDKLGKCRICAWPRIKRLMMERFLPGNYEKLLEEKYGLKQQHTIHHLLMLLKKLLKRKLM